MRPKYCLPIITPHKAAVVETIQNNLADYEYFEVWLDYVEDIDEAFIHQLIELLGGRLILLFRRQNLEAIKMPFDHRLSILQLLKDTDVLVDLDINQQSVELDYIREHGLGLRTIVSYHNYEQTPNTVQLQAVIATMAGYRPGIYKLATLCNSPEDGLRLLDLLLQLKVSRQSVIVLGMGEFGRITRVFGAQLGNEMTFAPKVKDESSAPGQLTRDQLEIIFKELER